MMHREVAINGSSHQILYTCSVSSCHQSDIEAEDKMAVRSDRETVHSSTNLKSSVLLIDLIAWALDTDPGNCGVGKNRVTGTSETKVALTIIILNGNS